MKRREKYWWVCFAWLFFVGGIFSQESDNFGNGLPATDALGRKLVSYDSAGKARKDRFVGLFYWTWHTNFSNCASVHDVSKILEAHPEAINDYHHPAWPKDAGYYFWHEPLWGYYRDTDHWVLRKQAEMLADAGVDVIIFDCTNGSFTWKESYMELCKVFSEAREDGVNTPQIAFILAFAPTPGAYDAINDIYDSLYKPGLYKDLWFHWKGKPLIMAYPEMLGDVPGNEEQTARNREIREFFTFRPGQPVYNKGPERPDHWGWLEIYPQHGFAYDEQSGKYEQMTVGVAQNWSAERGLTAMNAPNTFGRSYTHQPIEKRDDAVNWGYNFQEQWDRAIEMDPEFIFITGWNEWIAGRYEVWQQQKNAFPDQFSQEKSRDVEPMKGGHGDNYYYQMVNNIRRFKGMPGEPEYSPGKHMKIDGAFDDWENVLPDYNSYKGNTLHRESKGFADLYYRNTTGRNDFVKAKVTSDKKNVYFYVETSEPITSENDNAWMRLLIDIDRNKETGWEGYDYIVNRVSPQKGKACLERSKSGWNWEPIGEIDYSVVGNKMELRIPCRLLGNLKEKVFEFKWSDNMQEEGDIMDFYLNGDVAPLGRFNYLYKPSFSE